MWSWCSLQFLMFYFKKMYQSANQSSAFLTKAYELAALLLDDQAEASTESPLSLHLSGKWYIGK